MTRIKQRSPNMRKFFMQNTKRHHALCAAALLLLGLSAQAATLVDTGTPNGNAVGAYALDNTDFIAGQFSLTQRVDVTAIQAHVLGAAVGETFTLALYADNTLHLPGNLLFSAQARVAAEGWNGLASLTGWTLAPGLYWVGVEVGAADTASSALLDRGAPTLLARTAFNDGSTYVATVSPMSFGLRLDATVVAVPEPAQWVLMAAGLFAMTLVRRSAR